MINRTLFVAGLAVGAWIAWAVYEGKAGLEALADLTAGRGSRSSMTFRSEAAVSFPMEDRLEGLPGPRDSRGLAPGSRELQGIAAPDQALPPTPNEIAEKYLAENRERLGIRDYHELRPVVYENPLGASVKYDIYQGGLPVAGLTLRLEIGADGTIASVDNQYQPVPQVDLTQPFLSTEQILQRHNGRYRLDEVSTKGVSKLLHLSPGSDEAEMAYAIPVKDASSTAAAGETLLFRATDGQIIGRNVSRGEF